MFFEASDGTGAAYQRAVNDAFLAQRDQGFNFNLALVETEERFKQLHGGANAPDELRRPKTISDTLTLGWLELFQRKAKALEK